MLFRSKTKDLHCIKSKKLTLECPRRTMKGLFGDGNEHHNHKDERKTRSLPPLANQEQTEVHCAMAPQWSELVFVMVKGKCWAGSWREYNQPSHCDGQHILYSGYTTYMSMYDCVDVLVLNVTERHRGWLQDLLDSLMCN